jgi:hypothetical protein
VRRYFRAGRAEWALAGALAAMTGLMVVYPPSQMWNLAAQALAVAFYFRRRAQHRT